MIYALGFGFIALVILMLWWVWGPRFKPDHAARTERSYADRAEGYFDPDLQSDGDVERWLKEKR